MKIETEKTTTIQFRFNVSLTTLQKMFSDCSSITTVEIENIEAELIRDTSEMFKGCTELMSINFKNFTTEKLEIASGMFNGCSELKNLNLESILSNNITDMNSMFNGCSNLVQIDFPTGLQTDNLQSMSQLFTGCSSLESLNLTGFKTSKVTNMEYLFEGCSQLTSIDLTGFSTSQVTSMKKMFGGCEKLIEIDLSSFNTGNVQSMEGMFEGCVNLTSLDLSNFNTAKVTTMESMFSFCLNLTVVDYSSFSLEKCKNFDNMFSNCTRKILLSIEENTELCQKAGSTWTEFNPIIIINENDTNFNNTNSSKPIIITKKDLDVLFMVDATGSMSGSIASVKNYIVTISVALPEEEELKNFNLNIGGIFYRDPLDSPSFNHQYKDFAPNPLDFKNYVNTISPYGGYGGGPEDWVGAFNIAKNLTWRKDSVRIIILISDNGGHGTNYGGTKPEQGSILDGLIKEIALANYGLAGFRVAGNGNYARNSFARVKTVFTENGNDNIVIKDFNQNDNDSTYFVNLVIEVVKDLTTNQPQSSP